MKKISLLFLSCLLLFYAAGWVFCSITYPVSYRQLIQEQAKENQLDPLLVAALIFAESRYQSEAISKVGAMGLMQLMPRTAAEMALKKGWTTLTEKDFFDKEVNIKLGTFYLAGLFKRFEKAPIWLPLASYNAGERKVRKWQKEAKLESSRDEIIQFPETKRYVKQILWVYQGLLFWAKIGMV